MDKNTVICRCEDVTLSDLESVFTLGAETFDDVKRFTRCGMGPCQAKSCFHLTAQFISQYKNIPLSTISYTHMRLPLRMISLESLLPLDPTEENLVSNVGNKDE